jgi:hypothetical protein
MAQNLQDHVVARLASSGADKNPWSFIILAALYGPQALATYLTGGQAPAFPAPAKGKAAARAAGKPAPGAAAGPAIEPPGVFLGAITVSGFRGIGPETRLPLHAGPGLTLVVGRNGSGKSSFAEGVEVLLTGTSLRWAKRAVAWKEGWRNLHKAQAATVSAELVVEGQGPLTAARTWTADAELDRSVATARAKGGKAMPLESLGWTGHLATFRPFLSYNELGSMLEDGPSKVYDALAPVLGLDEFVAVQTTPAEARKTLNAHLTSVKAAATTLAQQAEQVERSHPREARAVRLAAALKAKTWDLPALRTLAEGGLDATRDALDGLRRLAAMSPPDVEAVQRCVLRLREAEAATARHAGSDAARSLARARLLEQALGFHAAHARGDASCPVCGAGDALSDDWAARSQREIESLHAEAAAVRAAEDESTAAVREARALVRESGVLPSAAAGELPSLQALREVEARWLQARGIDRLSALADHLEAHVLDVADATARVASDAAAELARREDVWRPLAQPLAAWLPAAEQLATSKARLDDLKDAEAWWKDTIEAVRDERFQPIAERAMATWRQLRLQSNVDLGGVELEGTSTRRKVVLKVTVDGKDAGALGVMSQGELHSLALSLFLPRATLAESPFRFICVDDPVQSMDPARVEGLARVLADTARTRQVIVFTHDDRLYEAVRRLGIPARVLRVTRRAQSVVEVREALDPVSGHLEDARAVLKTSNLRADVKGRVIPGFCRMALEAVCTAAVRERRLRKGAQHSEVDALLDEHVKLFPLMALALFDDPSRTGEVLNRLNTRVGRWAGDALTACNLGAHEHYNGDLEGLVSDVDKLTRGLAKANA